MAAGVSGNGRCVVGLVTIGQSPRVDVTPELLPLLGSGARVVERGALDPLTDEEIAGLAPAFGESVLVSRLRDGRQATLRRAALVDLIQAAIDSLAGQVDVILMLCTGTFAPFRSPHPVLYPEHLLFHVVRGVLGEAGGKVGVITPDAGQVEEQRQRWAAAIGTEPVVVACSPYRTEGLEDRLRAAAVQLKAAGTGLIVLDCLGYTRGMKQLVRQEAGVPVLLARTVLARVAAELVEEEMSQ